MGRKQQFGKYQNSNGYQYQEELPERGPGVEKFDEIST